MAIIYLDSSALVKRYAMEQGTAWVVRLVDPTADHDLYKVRLTRVEATAALQRKVRTGEATVDAIRRADVSFMADWRRQYRVIECTDSVVEQAARLAQRYPLRGYDAVHLAAALALDTRFRVQGERATLVSADEDQLEAAAAEGMMVDNPNAHP